MQRLKLAVVGLVVLLLSSVGYQAVAIEKIDPDPKAVQLVSDLLAALSKDNADERLQAVLPLVHKSLLAPDGKDLKPTIKEFSYKKASGAAKLYQQPAAIFQVQKGRDGVTIGFKATAEKGRIDKYFVKKKDGEPGRPAPILVFWPADGGDPKVDDMGSL